MVRKRMLLKLMLKKDISLLYFYTFKNYKILLSMTNLCDDKGLSTELIPNKTLR